MNQETKAVPIPSWWPIYSTLAISLLGILDAGFLTYKSFTAGLLPCVLFKGCDVVTTSIFSRVSGIPIALFGALFYLTVFVLCLMMVDRSRMDLLTPLFLLATLAFTISLGLVYIQIAILKSICLYCMISAGSSTLIFLFSAVAWKNSFKI